MRAYRAPVALAVIALAVLGAVLHPIAFVIAKLPFDTGGLVSLLNETKSFIADLLGWGLVALLLLMAAFIVRGRLAKPRVSPRRAHLEQPDPHSQLPGARQLAVAITAYNDAEATAAAVRQFKAQPGVIEVIVIDNNSSDNTAELATAAGARVVRERQQGYGYACIRGLWEAARVPDADVVVLTEGDGTFVGDDIPKLQAYIGQADMVVGTRAVRGLVETGSQMDYFFTWGNMAVAFLLRLRFWDGQFLGAAGLTDVGCTLRAIRRDALERILPDLAVGGNHFLPHMTLLALAKDLSILEIPITFRRRVGRSKGASQSLRKGLVVGLAMIWHIVTYRPHVRAKRRPTVLVNRNSVVHQTEDHARAASHIGLVPGAVDGLAKLSRNGYRVVVMAPESPVEGIGIASQPARQIDRQLTKAVEQAGGRIDSFLQCPHSLGSSCLICTRSALLLRAKEELKIDLASAYVVGDRPLDIEAAQVAGCRPVLVMSPERSVPVGLPSDCELTPDLSSAVDMILRNTHEQMYQTRVTPFPDLEDGRPEETPELAAVR